MATRVNGENFAEALAAATGLVLVDFYSDSCIPCKRMAPLLAELEETYAGKLEVLKVNLNYDLPLAECCEVQAAPTLILFRDGTEQTRIRGAVKRAELVEIIEKLID